MFRQGFSDTLKQQDVEISIIEDITGHLGRTEGEICYTQIAKLGLMQKAINVYPIITGHLESKPPQLPFVEAFEPAPWFKIRKAKPSRVVIHNQKSGATLLGVAPLGFINMGNIRNAFQSA